MEEEIDYTTCGYSTRPRTTTDPETNALRGTNTTTIFNETDAGPCPNPANIYNINIKQLNYGYVVNIGCQSFAIENSETLIKGLSNYLKSPSECENIWMNKKQLPL